MKHMIVSQNFAGSLRHPPGGQHRAIDFFRQRKQRERNGFTVIFQHDIHALSALRVCNTGKFSQFFHILGAVEQQNGCCEVRPGEYERTIYTSCWNADRGIYYYTTYTNRRISAVELRREDLDAAALIRYPMHTREDIFYQNAPGTES